MRGGDDEDSGSDRRGRHYLQPPPHDRLCSPTRASLLTGRNHHHVDNGQIVELLLRQRVEHYSGSVGTGTSGWDVRADRSIAMAAYAMTPATTQRISVR